jgi:hypothetical protein
VAATTAERLPHDNVGRSPRASAHADRGRASADLRTCSLMPARTVAHHQVTSVPKGLTFAQPRRSADPHRR